MTTVARKKGTQTFEATHLWNSLKIRILIWGLQWMNYHFSLNWSLSIKYAHAIPHRLDPLATEDAEDDHEAVHEVGEVPSWHHFLREPLHVVWNTLELSDDFPGRPPENLSLCDQKFITAHFTIRPTNLYSFCRRAACPWQRRWRWWYRGRMWGFPEHQWFSP